MHEKKKQKFLTLDAPKKLIAFDDNSVTKGLRQTSR